MSFTQFLTVIFMILSFVDWLFTQSLTVWIAFWALCIIVTLSNNRCNYG